ncbi:hypothetical protein G7046_g4366 [Stylonectria norvegica]|nr:hypothetical protein G7046_g4366 [Stylonectria norvegica]
MLWSQTSSDQDSSRTVLPRSWGSRACANVELGTDRLDSPAQNLDAPEQHLHRRPAGVGKAHEAKGIVTDNTASFYCIADGVAASLKLDASVVRWRKTSCVWPGSRGRRDVDIHGGRSLNQESVGSGLLSILYLGIGTSRIHASGLPASCSLWVCPWVSPEGVPCCLYCTRRCRGCVGEVSLSGRTVQGTLAVLANHGAESARGAPLPDHS